MDFSRDGAVLRITFIVPIFNEQKTLEPLVQAIRDNCLGHAPRIVLVDDGSADGSKETIDALAGRIEGVEAVHFGRNEGKTAALVKGFSMADGEVVFTLDADLQDDPKEIPRFLAELEKGYDLVCGWKSVRRDPLSRRVLSRCYNLFVGRVFGLTLHDVNCGYKAMKLRSSTLPGATGNRNMASSGIGKGCATWPVSGGNCGVDAAATKGINSRGSGGFFDAVFVPPVLAGQRGPILLLKDKRKLAQAERLGDVTVGPGFQGFGEGVFVLVGRHEDEADFPARVFARPSTIRSRSSRPFEYR